MENENIPQSDPTSLTPPSSIVKESKSKSRSKITLILILIFILFLSLIAIFSIYFYILNSNQQSSTPVTHINNYWKIDETVNHNWKKYINPNKYFSLEAPSNWIFESYGNGAFLYSPDFKWGRSPLEDKRGIDGALVQLIITDTTKKSLDEWGNSPENTGQNKELIKIGNVDALQYTSDDEIHIDIIHNGNLYRGIIYFYNNTREENIRVFNQILSTFKFTNKDSADKISNWTDYKENLFGYTFKYPQGSKIQTRSFDKNESFPWNEINVVDSSGNLIIKYVGNPQGSGPVPPYCLTNDNKEVDCKVTKSEFLSENEAKIIKYSISPNGNDYYQFTSNNKNIREKYKGFFGNDPIYVHVFFGDKNKDIANKILHSLTVTD